MPNVATSVRINDSAMNILSGLATKLGQPKAQIIEIALRELAEKTFWADVHQAFEQQAAADPVEGASQQSEIALWDRAAQEDFKDEKW